VTDDNVIPLPSRPPGYTERKAYAASGPHCGQMEMSAVVIRQTDRGYEAALRGDAPLSGDHGYWVSVIGWGQSEAEARASLAAALDNLRRNAGDFR